MLCYIIHLSFSVWLYYVHFSTVYRCYCVMLEKKKKKKLKVSKINLHFYALQKNNRMSVHMVKQKKKEKGTNHLLTNDWISVSDCICVYTPVLPIICNLCLSAYNKLYIMPKWFKKSQRTPTKFYQIRQNTNMRTHKMKYGVSCLFQVYSFMSVHTHIHTTSRW